MSAVKLKLCGVKSVAEAKQLRDAGVDLVGLNFIPGSSRYISLETARAIMAEFEGASLETVALFAGRPVEEINDYAGQLGVDYIQLHGNEPAAFARSLTAAKVIRAIPVNPGQPAEDLIKFINDFPADYFVLDRPRQGQGEPVAAELAAQVTAANPGRIFLAGGLTPDNLAAVLTQVRPYGIDIAGGVRDSDDDLDIAKVAKCLEITRSVGGQPS